MKTLCRSLFFNLLIFSCILSFSGCATKDNETNVQLREYLSAFDAPDFPLINLVLFIPVEGNCHCTAKAIDFSKENADRADVVFVLIGSNRKVMKISVGEQFMERPNVILDQGFALAQNLVLDDQYPYAYQRKEDGFAFVDLSARNESSKLDRRYDEFEEHLAKF